jgi:hypothetical protein
LNEVTQELQERVHRWKQIELLCGFNIINNNGLQYLESVLYRATANGRGTLRGESQLYLYVCQSVECFDFAWKDNGIVMYSKPAVSPDDLSSANVSMVVLGCVM